MKEDQELLLYNSVDGCVKTMTTFIAFEVGMIKTIGLKENCLEFMLAGPLMGLQMARVSYTDKDRLNLDF